MTVAERRRSSPRAVGGMNVTEVVEGRERYPVNLRYTPEYRDSTEKLRALPIVTPTKAQVRLGGSGGG